METGRPGVIRGGRSFAHALERCLQFFRPSPAHLGLAHLEDQLGGHARPGGPRGPGGRARSASSWPGPGSRPAPTMAVSAWWLSARTANIYQAALAPNRPLGSVSRHRQFRRVRQASMALPAGTPIFKASAAAQAPAFARPRPGTRQRKPPLRLRPFGWRDPGGENAPLQPGAVFTACRRSRPAGRRRDRREPPPFPRARARRNRP